MESLLRCIFSNPKATFNFIKKRMKSNLAAGQLVVCVISSVCCHPSWGWCPASPPLLPWGRCCSLGHSLRVLAEVA